MARYDKYDSQVSGFRANLAASLTLVNGSVGPVGVGLDANGRVVLGAGNSGIKAVLVKNMTPQGLIGSGLAPQATAPGAIAGDVVDCMIHGEIADITGLIAGTQYTANTTTGVITSAAASATQIVVGFTVEATRLVVNMAN